MASTNSVILMSARAEVYEKRLRAASEREAVQGEGMVYISPWNDRREGNHLQPDLRFGRAFLEGTKRALNEGGNGAS